MISNPLLAAPRVSATCLTGLRRGLIPLLLLTGLLLSACATPRPGAPPPAPADWEQHRQQLAALQHWEVRGKLGYRSPETSGSASLTWLQDFHHFNLVLTGPMGAGATRIRGHPELAVLTRGHEEIRAHSPSALTRQALGVNLPLEELLWWVRGLPAPGEHEALGLDDDRLLASLEQADWQLQFTRYAEVDGLYLPGRISGTGTGIHEGLGFTLVINQWQPRRHSPMDARR